MTHAECNNVTNSQIDPKSGLCYKRKVIPGQGRRVPSQFGKIIPKKASTFIQRKLLPSHVSKNEESHVIVKRGSCSLKSSLSPATSEDASVENVCFIHHRGPSWNDTGYPIMLQHQGVSRILR